MSNQELKIIQTTESEFKEILSQTISLKLREHLETISKDSEGETILTREQAATLLGINLSTLNSYTKKKLLKSYMIKGTGRVYYKKSEVIEALELI